MSLSTKARLFIPPSLDASREFELKNGGVFTMAQYLKLKQALKAMNYDSRKSPHPGHHRFRG